MIIPPTIAPEGFKVPISCSFTGIKFLPFLSLANNSANPSLMLYNERVSYKVLRTSGAHYAEIEKIDADYNALMQNLTLNFKNSVFTLTVRMNRIEDLREIIRFFERKSVALSAEALELVTN